MKVEQIYTNCLSQGSYYIESNNEVAIIDPLREADIYISKAKSSNSKIKFIFETHIHADFISGHLNLAKKSGAEIVYGPKTETSFENIVAKDYQEFKIGDITIVAIHTPGHTIESTTYLLKDSSGKDHAIFTGDTLFIGDVGRPDLSQNSSMSNRDLASMLFDSLRKKIMTLSDDVIIYPGHGEGSSCGKDLSSETIGTLGDQKRTNYALREKMTKDEFIKEVLDGLLDPPKYFPDNVMLNKEGYDESDEIINRSLKALTAEEVASRLKEKITILDVRSVEDFSSSHIPGSIFIGLDGRFAPWVGEILEDVSKKLILIAPEGREKEAIIRLSRVGFDNVIGYLEGGINSWIKNGGIVSKVLNESASKFSTIDNDKDILDVRSKNEHKSESLLNSINIPLIDLSKSIDKVSFEKTFYVHCKGGYRSMIAASILLANGISNFSNIAGGYDKIKNYNS
ncbi:MAG: rhodanese-like domain-containing protein [Candidatus Marisimplicoccus sp.]|jgi:glyoxylase-like metal-dependent hydrolase (beta-lactamase superfamily II)/rhodanese-related sulfurtransferase|tara:strand:- start:1316 stop:2680 length:1365 start_codon:yes stop_codon:yes gene_type:complete